MYLGVKAVLAKSFSRIHKSNLINFGIMPLEFVDASDYEKVSIGTKIRIGKAVSTLQNEAQSIRAQIDNRAVEFKLTLTRRLRSILIAGGLLNYIKSSQ